MGLAPHQHQQASADGTADGGFPSFIEQVHYYGQDTQGKRYSPFSAIFSFYMVNSDYYDGKFVFGGYDLKYAKDGLNEFDVFWMPMRPSFYYWTSGMTKSI